MLIQRLGQLDDLCRRLREAATAGGVLAIDTEFISERRYSPRLCLVQVYIEVANGAIEALIDPLTTELHPLLEILGDETIRKIVHAGGQDLQIFCQDYGCMLRGVFDTQIAAAFLGFGHQVGYSDLVRRVLKGVQLSKDSQYTDWAARPLSAAQMEYALNDVRYLPEIYEILKRDLEARGRLSWAEAEFDRAETKACETTPPDELYRRFNLASLSRRQLGTLRELAALREDFARSMNKPSNFIASDPTLLQMAKQPPQNNAALRAIRGVSPTVLDNARDFLDAVKRAAALPEELLPEEFTLSDRPDSQTDAVASLLGVVAQVRSSEQDISRSYLAPRDQLVALAAWWMRRDPAIESPLPDLPVLRDWRFEIVGRELLDILAGKIAVALDPRNADAPDQSIIRTTSLP